MAQIAACTRGFLLRGGLQSWASKLQSRQVWCESTKYNRRKFRQMEKQRWKEPEKRKEEERRSEKRKSQKKEDAGAQKGGKVAKHCVFPMFCGSGGSKNRHAKAAGRSHLVRWEIKNYTPSWREADFQVIMLKTHQPQSTFGSWDVQKVHGAVARSAFGSQNVKTAGPEHFRKLRCSNSARGCGAKQVSKPNMLKHPKKAKNTPCSEHFWKLGRWKSAPLWCEAHVESNMLKNPRLRSAFGSLDVEKVHVIVARSTFPSQC